MKKIALVTCARLPELDPSDRALIPAFAQRNIEAKAVIWDDPRIDWLGFDALIIRNTWDYYLKSESFIEWIHKLKTYKINVLNDRDILLNNIHKFYLKGFEKQGIPIIPTLFIGKNTELNIDSIPWEKFVVKPAISAGSYLTQVHEKFEFAEGYILELGENKDWLIQPFLPQIQSEGELSMIYIGRKFSHAVRKKPIEGDFRVQKQYGGLYEPFVPNEELLQMCNEIIDGVEGKLLFARVDGLMLEGVFHLMELEMIEPDLYMHFEQGSYANFVNESIKLISHGN